MYTLVSRSPKNSDGKKKNYDRGGEAEGAGEEEGGVKDNDHSMF